MKKTFIIVAIAAFALVGCKHNDTSRQANEDRMEMSDNNGHRHMHNDRQNHRKAEMEARRAQMEAKKAEREAKINEAWKEFDKLSDAEKIAWVEESKKIVDRRDSIRIAKQAEMDAKWATFDKASLEEKVELLKMRGITYRQHNFKEGHGHGPRGMHNDNHSAMHGNHNHHGNHGDHNHKHHNGGQKFHIDEMK